MKSLIISRDEELMRINLKKLINKRYKPPIINQIKWFFESFAGVILILFFIPFLTLIKIFQIIFNRE